MVRHEELDSYIPSDVRKALQTLEREDGTPAAAEAADRVAVWYMLCRHWEALLDARTKAYEWTPAGSPLLARRALGLGDAYQRAGERERAITFYTTFLERHPNAPKGSRVAGVLINALGQVGRHEEALQRYDQLSREYPELASDLDAQSALRRAYIALADYDNLQKVEDRISALRRSRAAGPKARP